MPYDADAPTRVNPRRWRPATKTRSFERSWPLTV